MKKLQAAGLKKWLPASSLFYNLITDDKRMLAVYKFTHKV